MKRYLSIAVVLLLGLSACDVLDNNPYFMGESADQIFTDADKIAVADIGLYDALQNGNYLGGRAQIYVDARGLDVNPPTFFGNLSTFNPTSSDGIIGGAWQGAYRTVYESNVFLAGIEGAKSEAIISEEEYQLYASDAKFVRALSYMYALNFWGQMHIKESQDLGIPLVLEAYDGSNAFTAPLEIPRSSVAECYNQIIADLQYAETYLPETREDLYGGRGTATKLGAQALLCRVYLYMGDNANAVSYAQKLAGKYTLEADAITNFTSPESSSELIFGVAMNITDNPNTNNAIGQHYGMKYRADITVSDDYMSLLSDEDQRSKDFIIQNSNTEAWYCNKYRNGSGDWAPIIRYAEILLNEAEALVKISSMVDDQAISLLNEVRQRSEPTFSYAASDFANSDELLEAILTERRRELAFEGHGSFDLFRNKKGIPPGRGAANAAEITYPDNSFAFPIPNSDMEKSKVLVQNPGY